MHQREFSSNFDMTAAR